MDGDQHDDVLAGIWKVGLANMAPIQCFAGGPVRQSLRTIRKRYRRRGLNPRGDERGVIDIQAAPHCNGIEVWIRPSKCTRRLSSNSPIRPLILNSLRTRGVQLPLCRGEDGQPMSVAGCEECAISGTANWRTIEANSGFEIDTLWRHTALILWEQGISEVF